MIYKNICRFAAALAALLAPAALASAKETKDVFRAITDTEQFSFQPDRAYLLIHISTGAGAPTFLRIPSSQELDTYETERRAAFVRAVPDLLKKRDAAIERQRITKAQGRAFKETIPPLPSIDNYDFVYDGEANISNVPLGKSIEKGPLLRTYLLEVIPGDYVYYGVGFANAVHTCLCLGTVGFEARAGYIIDLGDYLVAPAWKASDIPELAHETDLGASVNGHTFLWATAIRPKTVVSSMPSVIANKAIEPVHYHAVGKFVSPLAFNINRLAPITGVLGYIDGRVIDETTGQETPNNY